MDGTQLRQHLEQIVKKHGLGHLRQIEVEYLQGRITYNTYLQTCWQEYCDTLPHLNTRTPRTDQGAVYD